MKITSRNYIKKKPAGDVLRAVKVLTPLKPGFAYVTKQNRISHKGKHLFQYKQNPAKNNRVKINT